MDGEENNKKVGVSFHSENLMATKAKEKREVFTNVARKESVVKKPIRKIQESHKALAKNKKARRTIAICLVIIVSTAAGIVFYPKIKYYLVPNLDRGFELINKNPDKGLDYLYSYASSQKTDEQKRKILTGMAFRLIEIGYDDKTGKLEKAVLEAYNMEPSNETVFIAWDYYSLMENEEEIEKWAKLAKERGMFKDE